MSLNTAPSARIESQPRSSPANPKAGERFRRYREGNLGQLAFFCSCGALPPLTAGLCSSCYGKWRHSVRRFGGHRETVLERDRGQCRACGSEHWIGVHHRQPGENDPFWLITLCAACHAQIHRLLSLWKWIPELLAELWAEQHPGVPVQLQIKLSAQLELSFAGREEGVPRG